MWLISFCGVRVWLDCSNSTHTYLNISFTVLFMVHVTIDIRKSVEENAATYFEQAKKAKRKLAGIDETIRRFRDELAKVQLQKEKAVAEEKKKQEKVVRKKEWYEKFHWFISSEGFLCIGGRDATSNEVVIKKHTEKDDLVFHTEAPGSPFFVIKTEVFVPSLKCFVCFIDYIHCFLIVLCME